MRRIALFTLAGALALSACDRKPAEEPQPANNMMEVPQETIPADEAEAPAAVPNNTTPAAPPAPPPEISEDQQMQDDADATGMTARLPEESSGVPTNQVRPAE
ncbi:MAG: hypothetical protein QHC67_02170 [Sphingobium sp.]|uniref:hypothetical protein n=1 Tax=Sphingobium sp. TaxID=1912891 RepID=UPI0029ACC7DF|nr:hypothetical protein [Sphingobium sp.]MDX3908604.1 hypothetical protein [Sphingobium sp.]